MQANVPATTCAQQMTGLKERANEFAAERQQVCVFPVAVLPQLVAKDHDALMLLLQSFSARQQMKLGRVRSDGLYQGVRV